MEENILTKSELEAWLKQYLLDLTEIPAEEIDINKSFESYGLDSSDAIGLSGDLSEKLSVELDPEILYEQTSIAKLLDHCEVKNYIR